MNGAERRTSLLNDEQRFDWLRLIRSESIGPRTFRKLINTYGGARAALDALPHLVRRSGRAALKIASVESIAQEMDIAHRMGARFIALGEPDYPAALRMIDDAPPLIAVRGFLPILQRPMLALVGSRNSSAIGLAMAEKLTRGVAEADFVVVSGLARGIDARAHRTALETGTVAVLAGGHDRIYPSEHGALLEQILERGVVVSEMPFGWEPRGRDFPRRNRIVSGMSLGTVVVEAARRSGSLITARFALEQGREVFAVPGSPMDPRSEGANDLLRQGANLCASAQDIIDAIVPLMEAGPPQRDLFREDEPHGFEGEVFWDELDTPKRDEEGNAPATSSASYEAKPGGVVGTRRAVVDLLGVAPVAVDELVRECGQSISDVQIALLDLELAGRLVRHGSNLVSLKPL